jgi:hypothetical protein
MLAHELAKKLLEGADKEVRVLTNVSGRHTNESMGVAATETDEDFAFIFVTPKTCSHKEYAEGHCAEMPHWRDGSETRRKELEQQYYGALTAMAKSTPDDTEAEDDVLQQIDERGLRGFKKTDEPTSFVSLEDPLHIRPQDEEEE